jgi:glycerol-3-phosphate dehydrogenase (NAD(P)+)
MKIGIIGAGSWGTALAVVLHSNRHNVTLWTYSQEDFHVMASTGFNRNYLPSLRIPDEVHVTHDLDFAISGKDILVISTPSQFVRSVLVHAPKLGDHLPFVVNVAKGIEHDTLLRMSEVIDEAFPTLGMDRYAILSGPSHAEEVSMQRPTSLVVASKNQSLCRLVIDSFMTSYFRVYSSSDVIGVELGGALKNVIAIGAGICDGSAFGDNTKAALITRGIAEMRRLGIVLGADPHTFAGLSGLGDLIVTTMSKYSRNRFVGEEIGRGKKLNEILAGMKMIAEGVETTRSAVTLSRKHGVEMPIMQEVYRILFEGKEPVHATMELMTRQAKDEVWG